MIRRGLAVLAWLLTLSLTTLWVWVIVESEFMNSMLAAVPAEQQESLSQGWWIVAYAAMVGLFIVTVANATVGLLLEIDPARIRASLVAAVASSVSPTRVDLWLRRRPR